MSTNENSKTSLIKQPAVIALGLVVVAVAVILVNEKSDSLDTDTAAMNTTQSTESATSPEGLDSGMQIKPQAPGGDTPRIVANMNQERAGSVSAPGLENLVKGLEDKVASDPTNVNNRLLLAQTYNELGMQDKALTEMRSLQKDNPDNGRINLILGSILSNSSDQEKVKESLTLLDKASGDKTIQQYLVHMYRGDALIRMQDHEGALEQWKLALKDMPPADNRRARLEQRVSELSAMENKKQEAQAGNS
jgi:cytochrome c-type biogenesis protein CcmH/NrfG